MSEELFSIVPLTCPTCGTGLRFYSSGLRYECRSGHQYSSADLDHVLREQLYHTVTTTLRQIEERERLLKLMAKHGLLPHAETHAPLPPSCTECSACLPVPTTTTKDFGFSLAAWQAAVITIQEASTWVDNGD